MRRWSMKGTLASCRKVMSVVKAMEPECQVAIAAVSDEDAELRLYASPETVAKAEALRRSVAS